MGVVYLGRDDVTGTRAAVKVIKPEHAANQHFRARLRREVAAARRVPRFCTAPVLDADLDAEPPWVATEYIDGPTLDVALLEEGPLQGAELEAFAVAVAVALRAIHQHGVIHRDLKPSNVLLSPLGPRVIDFGIARLDDAHTALTQAAGVLGTPAYMAPEQIRGEPATAAIDVFAWAGLVVYAACGRPPFGTGEDVMRAILHRPPDLGDIGDPLRGLLTAALEKDPGSRPSASTLVDRLDREASPAATVVLATAAQAPASAEATAPVAAGRPPVPPARPRRPARRPVALLGAALAVTVAVTTALFLLPDRDRGGAGGLVGGATPTDQAISPAVAPALDPASFAFGTQIGEPLTGHTGNVSAVAFGELGGDPIAVSAGSIDESDYTVRIWDLTTGEQLGGSLTGHTSHVTSVAVAERDGDPVAVSASDDETVRVWDLATGSQVGEPLTGHTYRISSVVTARWRGDPIAVSGGSGEGAVRAWDLAAEKQLGDPFGSIGEVYEVAVGELDGDPIVIAAGREVAVGREVEIVDLLRVWDLATGAPIGEPLTGHTSFVTALAVTTRRGDPIAVTGSDDQTIRVWNLRTGEQVGEPFTGHTGHVASVAVGSLDGDPIVVSGGGDKAIRVWDLGTGEPIGEPFTGHTEWVSSVALGEWDGVPIAVSGSDDGTLRVWSLRPPAP
jgi:WD40 repeat protein/tRNA A-37 threonylcarbamoyl transferase component Bud32